jgi:hypothetical protein
MIDSDQEDLSHIYFHPEHYGHSSNECIDYSQHYDYDQEHYGHSSNECIDYSQHYDHDQELKKMILQFESKQTIIQENITAGLFQAEIIQEEIIEDVEEIIPVQAAEIIEEEIIVQEIITADLFQAEIIQEETIEDDVEEIIPVQAADLFQAEIIPAENVEGDIVEENIPVQADINDFWFSPYTVVKRSKLVWALNPKFGWACGQIIEERKKKINLVKFFNLPVYCPHPGSKKIIKIPQEYLVEQKKCKPLQFDETDSRFETLKKVLLIFNTK